MTRPGARRLAFLLSRASSATAAVVVASAVISSCYPNGGGGTDPPTDTFYFPVGLAVSAGGNALYAVNSDFDLQWNGGTLQSYDLFKIRQDTARLIAANLGTLTNDAGQPVAPQDLANPPYNIDFVQVPIPGQCLFGAAPTDGGTGFPTILTNSGGRIPLGQACAPAVFSTPYIGNSQIIGAFASTLQLQSIGGATGRRLFAPVRGNASLTWADVGPDDDATAVPPEGDPAAHAKFGPFVLDCGAPPNGRCDATHTTGNFIDPNDLRELVLPGEPFAMAQTPDGTAIALTQRTETETSLLTAGLPPIPPSTTRNDPSMKFIVNGVVNSGSGIAAIPHDRDATTRPCELVNDVPPCVHPAFLETSAATAQIDLLRYFDDDGSTLKRPFLEVEATFPLTANFGGSDSLGIAIDATPRLACKAAVSGPAATTACAELPARVFIANRTPSSLIFGQVGGTSASGDGTFDPDLFTATGNLPLPAGPSQVYVAPIVNLAGNLELRVFVVNFDSSTISVIDPNNPNPALIDPINVGPGPFALAFDPFNLQDMATNAADGPDTRQPASLGLKKYRFAYVASFTQSFVQVIDLDQSQPTFESVVYTLGRPTLPKGQ
jgi:YVTN family beta-propeller protein